VGIGVCIRDDQGQFVLAKTEWHSPILDVDTGEALGLLSAMKWMRDLHLNNVVFELDSKRVVDSFKHNRRDESVFGDIIKDCKNVFILISQTLMLSLLGGKQMRSLTV
jgi:ribonuclease HI